MAGNPTTIVHVDAETCVSPHAAMEQVARLDPSHAHERLLAFERIRRATAYRCPLGPAPGIAYVLMTRKSLDAIQPVIGRYPSALKWHTMVFANTDANPEWITYYNLLYVGHVRVLHGHTVSVNTGTPDDPIWEEQADPSALCLVKFADIRWLLQNPTFTHAINRRYNVPALAYASGEYYEETKNGDDAWTWDSMLRNLWGRCEILGQYTTLPFGPDGAPENFQFVGMSAYDALNQVLARLTAALRYNPTVNMTSPEAVISGTTAFSIVKIADPDEPFTTALDSRRLDLALKIEDDEPKFGYPARVPYGVRVHFHVRSEHAGTEPTITKGLDQWTDQQVFTTDLIGPYEQYVEPDLYHPLWDDMLAVRAVDGTISNEAALEARATERKIEYYETLINGGLPLRRVFSGIVHELLPGSLCKGVAWHTDAFGVFVTEALNHHRLMLELDDNGQWRTVEKNSPLQPPLLGPTSANYPQLTQYVLIGEEVASGSGSGSGSTSGANCMTLWSGTIRHKDPATCAWIEECACWVAELNDGGLTVGRSYEARLNGNHTEGDDNRPLLIVDLKIGSSLGSAAQGAYCIDFVSSVLCSDGSLRVENKSLHSNFPIWQLNSSCSNPTGGNPGACPAGSVDSSGFSPCDCSPQIWTFPVAGVTNGSCSDCADVNGLITINFNSTYNYWISAVIPCYGNWYLAYTAPDWQLKLTVGSGGVAATYRLDGILWNCDGPNTLTKDVSADLICSGFPSTITLTRA